MKYNFNTIWQTVLSYLRLDRLSWIFIGLSVILNIILWVIWSRIHFSIFSIFLVTGILILNIILSIAFDSKGQIISYTLLGTALFCQILVAILLYNSVYF